MKLISKMYSSPLSAALLFSLLLSSGNATAQHYEKDYYDQKAGVTLYEDCKFRGESRTLSAGEYHNMGTFDFDNDSLSSIRVPAGYEVTIYEDDKFRGNYARIDRDIICFDKKWNDEVSSIRITAKHNYHPEPVYKQPKPVYKEPQPVHKKPHKASVTAKNVSRVVFNNRVLEQIADDQWRIADPEFGVSQYRETRRDDSEVLLQNEYTDERIRIDLFTNEVTVVGNSRYAQRYPITQKSAQRSAAVPPSYHPIDQYQPRHQPVANGCFNYKAYTLGGAGGVRFEGNKGFNRFSDKPITGKACHKGPLLMEINKRDVATTAVIEINGKQYTFEASEKETQYRNNWYRKNITVTP